MRALLTRPGLRLVTLTGPGGVGKTRLALQIAADLTERFSDGVALVRLAMVHDPTLVTTAIAQALGIREARKQMIFDVLVASLRAKHLLLVLDNFEQVLPAAPALVDLLEACAGLTLLVTSRAVLRVSGEHVFSVPPLAVPNPARSPTMGELQTYAAVQLFVERAQATQSAFTLNDENAAAVVEICRLLDGLPLAIELAAARVTLFPPQTLIARLAIPLPLLTSGARDLPERLRTMSNAIAWSYDLLLAGEQALFRRLAVFAGGFTLEAAEEICASISNSAESTRSILTGLAALVDASLVNQPELVSGEPRFSMLETLREYALERLAESGEEEAARRAHTTYFQTVAEQAQVGLRGPDQQPWHDRIEAELHNLRAALAWSTSPGASTEDADIGLRLGGALWYFWFQRGFPSEGRRWLSQALAIPHAHDVALATALLGAGTLAWRQGDYPAARAQLDESADLWQELDDTQGLAEALHILGHVQFDQRQYVAARLLFEASRAHYEQAGDTLGGLPLIGDLGMVAYHEGDYTAAGAIFEESLAISRQHKLKDRVADALNRLGDLARLARDDERALALYQESLALWQEIHGTPGIASDLHKLGQVHRRRGEDVLAGTLYAESLTLQLEIGNPQGIAECLAGLGGMASAAGDMPQAVRIFAASAALLATMGAPLAPADAVEFEQDMASARAGLDEAAWTTAWSSGWVLPLDQAVDEALGISRVAPRAIPPAPPAPPTGHRAPSLLSPREQEIAALVADGLSNREIADKLIIGDRTVETHISNILAKLHFSTRAQIAAWIATQAATQTTTQE